MWVSVCCGCGGIRERELGGGEEEREKDEEEAKKKRMMRVEGRDVPLRTRVKGRKEIRRERREKEKRKGGDGIDGRRRKRRYECGQVQGRKGGGGDRSMYASIQWQIKEN